MSNLVEDRKVWLEKYGLAVIIAVALVIRLVFILAYQKPMEPDAEHYFSLANSMLNGTGMGGNITRPPVYVFFLAAVLFLFGKNVIAVKVVQVMVSVMAVFLTYLIAQKLSKDRWLKLIAAGIVALDPYIIFYTGELLTETLFITLLMLTLYLLCSFTVSERQRVRDAVVIGLVIGITMMTRPVILGFIIFVVGIGYVLKIYSLHRLGVFGVLFLVLLLTLMPYALRNYKLTGKMLFTNIQAGWTMYEGLDPDFQDWDKHTAWQVAMRVESKDMDTLANDKFFRNKSLRYIKEHPGEFLVLCLRKLYKYWRLYPYYPQSQLYKFIGYVFTLPLYVLAVIGAYYFFKEQKRGFFVLSSLVVYYCLTAILFWTQIRYRVPLQPVLSIFAAAGIVGVAGKLSNKNAGTGNI
ncbi:MAG: glycosyltransferase family 39 protein [Elusimicrobiota bacterium]